MQQIAQQSRELQEFILAKYAFQSPDSDQDSDIQKSCEQQQDDLKNQGKVQSIEQNQESGKSVQYQTWQEQQQMVYQLQQYKRAKKNDNIILESPDFIDGVYLLKDQLKTPFYTCCDVSQSKKRVKRNQIKGSNKKQDSLKKNTQKIEDDTEKKGKFEDVAELDSSQEINKNQKYQEISEFLQSEGKLQTENVSRQNRKFKREQQINIQNFEGNGKKRYYPKMVKDQQCLYCDKKFLKLVTLLEHEADDHGIIRTKQQIFGDDLWDQVNKKQEIAQKEFKQLYRNMGKQNKINLSQNKIS